jgi:transposase-like protein
MAGRRKVERPSYEQLLGELREMSWVAIGRKYGVSDNAVRKWLRRYEAERDGQRSEISRSAA